MILNQIQAFSIKLLTLNQKFYLIYINQPKNINKKNMTHLFLYNL